MPKTDSADVVVKVATPTAEMAQRAGAEPAGAQEWSGVGEELNDVRLVNASDFEVFAVRVGRRFKQFANLPGCTADPAAPSRRAVARLGDDAVAVVVPFGVAVFFNTPREDRRTFLKTLKDFIEPADAAVGSEEAAVRLVTEVGASDRVTAGEILLGAGTDARLLVVADVLSKSVVLQEYEERIQSNLDRIGVLARELGEKGTPIRKRRRLMQHSGEMLALEADLLGGVQIDEKPDVLWERPGLKRLYDNLLEEYGLTERLSVMEHKRQVIGRTNQTLIDLINTRDSHRVEWYIFWLIAFEVIFFGFIDWPEIVERCHNLVGYF